MQLCESPASVAVSAKILGERIVADIDDIVRKVRFPDPSRTAADQASSHNGCGSRVELDHLSTGLYSQLHEAPVVSEKEHLCVLR